MVLSEATEKRSDRKAKRQKSEATEKRSDRKAKRQKSEATEKRSDLEPDICSAFFQVKSIIHLLTQRIKLRLEHLNISYERRSET